MDGGLSKVDLVVRNGRLLLGGELIEGGLAVDDGVIVAVAKDLSLPVGDTVYDAGGNLILPGFIDIHVRPGASPALATCLTPTPRRPPPMPSRRS